MFTVYLARQFFFISDHLDALAALNNLLGDQVSLSAQVTELLVLQLV